MLLHKIKNIFHEKLGIFKSTPIVYWKIKVIDFFKINKVMLVSKLSKQAKLTI